MGVLLLRGLSFGFCLFTVRLSRSVIQVLEVLNYIGVISISLCFIGDFLRGLYDDVSFAAYRLKHVVGNDCFCLRIVHTTSLAGLPFGMLLYINIRYDISLCNIQL